MAHFLNVTSTIIEDFHINVVSLGLVDPSGRARGPKAKRSVRSISVIFLTKQVSANKGNSCRKIANMQTIKECYYIEDPSWLFHIFVPKETDASTTFNALHFVCHFESNNGVRSFLCARAASLKQGQPDSAMPSSGVTRFVRRRSVLEEAWASIAS